MKNMQKYVCALAAFVLLATGCRDNSGLGGLFVDIDVRLTALEELCREMNTNISALQVLVTALEEGDAIVSVTPVLKDGKEIGYTVTFKNSDPITLYNGHDGNNGTDGDSMFRSVTQDDNYVYFTLADGTVITIAKGNAEEKGVEIVNGAIRMPFSVSATKKVYFSQGNLQYQASTDTWRFAEHQYDYIGGANKNISPSYTGWIDLFGWGTGNNPTLATVDKADYAAFTDWGVNAVSNGGNQPNQWRTLTKDEWEYLLAHHGYALPSKYAIGYINGAKGLFLCPEGWQNPLDVVLVDVNLSLSGWKKLEATGVVFLPAAGQRSGTEVKDWCGDGYYWSATPLRDDDAWYCAFFSGSAGMSYSTFRYPGYAVRLVQDAE